MQVGVDDNTRSNRKTKKKKEFKRIRVLGPIGIKIQTSTQINSKEHHCILIQYDVTISVNKPELTKTVQQFHAICWRSWKWTPIKDGRLNINFPASYSRYPIAIKTIHKERKKAIGKKIKNGDGVEREFNKFLKDENRCETDWYN